MINAKKIWLMRKWGNNILQKLKLKRFFSAVIFTPRVQTMKRVTGPKLTALIQDDGWVPP